jgi:hypothetical protein
MRAELSGVEVGQTGRAEHLPELQPGAERPGVGQRCGRQRPEGLLHRVCGVRGGSSGEDRICDDHDAHPTRWAQPGGWRHGDPQDRPEFGGHVGKAFPQRAGPGRQSGWAHDSILPAPAGGRWLLICVPQRPPKGVVSGASAAFIGRVDGAGGWCCRVIGRVFWAHLGGLLEPGDVSLERFAPVRG